MAIISAAVFGLALHVPSAIAVGSVSGGLNVVPYLGVLVAPILPLIADLAHLGTAHIVTIFGTCWGLHLVAINVVYPKLMGGRMQLNPLAATIAMLVWTCIWGAIGLIVAIPLTAMLKIACDRGPRLRSVGAWLGT
jgi:predicted PurR-regulated permease PerM